jgi:hypothetical protein
MPFFESLSLRGENAVVFLGDLCVLVVKLPSPFSTISVSLW